LLTATAGADKYADDMTKPAAITRCGTQALLMAVGVAASAGLIVAMGIVLTPVLSFMVVGTAPFAALIVAGIAAARLPAADVTCR
jgi:hypothetical protein